MKSPYQTPDSGLQEILPPRQYSHALFGALASFCLLLYFLYAYPYRTSRFDELETYFVPVICAMCVGLTLLIFRRLRWHLALLLGLVVTLVPPLVWVLVDELLGS